MLLCIPSTNAVCSLFFGGRCTLPASAPVPLSFSLPPALECLWHRSAGGWSQALQSVIVKRKPYVDCLCTYTPYPWVSSSVLRDAMVNCWLGHCAGETGTAHLFLPLWNIPVQQRQGESGEADSGTNMLCVVTSSGRQQGFQKPTVFISVRSRMYPWAHLCDQQKWFGDGVTMCSACFCKNTSAVSKSWFYFSIFYRFV